MGRAVALFGLLLLAGCGGVAGEDLFADTPITAPPICPIAEDEGACDEQPTGPLHLASEPAPGHATPPKLADVETEAPPVAAPGAGGGSP
jgi:hypothetical protein